MSSRLGNSRELRSAGRGPTVAARPGRAVRVLRSGKKKKTVDVWIPGCGRVATLNLELSPMMKPGAGKLRT